MPNEFSEYGLTVLPDAQQQRSKLPRDVLATFDDILYELARDPKRYPHPERVVPASRDGKSLVYMHPSPVLQITFEIDEAQKILYVINVAAPGFATKKTIFISYSREDEAWLQQLKKFLSVLEQQGIIEFWDDSRIQAGTDWRAEIEKALDSSRAALLLVSQDFLTSDFVTKMELPRLLADARDKGKRIFWIPVRDSTVFESHKEITRFQSLLTDPTTPLRDMTAAKREKALVQINKTLSSVIASAPASS